MKIGIFFSIFLLLLNFCSKNTTNDSSPEEIFDNSSVKDKEILDVSNDSLSDVFSLPQDGIDVKGAKELTPGIDFKEVKEDACCLEDTSLDDYSEFKVKADGSEVYGVGGKCIEITPPVVNFEGKIVGKKHASEFVIKNCSLEKDLKIYNIFLGLEEGGCNEFSIELPSNFAPEGGVNDENPIIIPPSSEMVVNVFYEPVDVSPKDKNGVIISDKAKVVIKTDVSKSPYFVYLSGYGIDQKCPVAVINVEEGEEVVPGTILHLDGSKSYAPEGTIKKFLWNVQKPSECISKFMPNQFVKSPAFKVTVAGEYIFSLEVIDSSGEKSCEPAKYKVNVIGDQAIRVELLWTTPNDPDETNEGPFAGSDLDLHFAHQNASQYDLDGDGKKDPWFDPLWDCFWFYPTQNWGDPSSQEDDPKMVIDDADGAGPEIVILNKPEDGVCYHVGVNYWDDHGYGKSFAKVSIYIYGVKVYESDDVMLLDHDMWWVATICWNNDTGTVTEKKNDDGTPYITHDYHHPLFYQP